MEQELIYRGSFLKFDFCFDVPITGKYLLAESNEEGYVFQLIAIDNKAGTIGGYIKIESSLTHYKAITKQHLEEELERNFLNLDKSSIRISSTVEFNELEES